MKTNTLLRISGVLILCLVISLLVNLYACAFSPIKSFYGAVDPSFFYMAGKAWAHGLLPYRDVFDVKGPIVFLLYRWGYMLTPDCLYGVFLLYVFTGTLTMALVCRLVRLMNGRTLVGLVVATLVMGVVYWKNIAYSGAQPELLALPVLTWLLGDFYAFLKKKGATETLTRRLAWCVGLGCAYVFLLKFNMVLPYVCAFVLAVFILWREKHFELFCGFFLRCCIGFVLVVIPFVVYFFLTDTLGDFVRDYFVTNYDTYFGHHRESFYAVGNPLVKMVRYNLKDCICIPSVVSIAYLFMKALTTGRENFSNGLMLTLLALSVYASCAVTIHAYYFIFCAPLTVFPLFALCENADLLHNRLTGVTVLCLSVFITCLFSERKSGADCTTETWLENELSTVKNAKVMYWRTVEQGFGYRSGALPADRVWASVNGVGEAFYCQCREKIMRHEPDFIFTNQQLDDKEREFLIASGYEPEISKAILITSGNGSLSKFLLWK